MLKFFFLTNFFSFFSGKIFLCLSSSWFCPRPPASACPPPLFIRQAITFDLGGQTFLDTFSPPRKVTYLSCLGEQSLLEDQWDCPMGGSPQLSHFFADILGVRLLLDHKEIPLPPALILNSSHQLGHWEPHNGEARSTKVVELFENEGREQKVQQEISAFLTSLKMKGHHKVGTCLNFWTQLKPSFPRWMPFIVFIFIFFSGCGEDLLAPFKTYLFHNLLFC